MTIATINIKPELLKTISKIAKRKGVSEDEIINNALEKGLKSTESKKEVFKRLERSTNGKIKILNKDTYNPTKDGVRAIRGIINIPADFDIVDIVEETSAGKYD